MSPKEIRELLSVGRYKGYGILSGRITPHRIGKVHRVRRRGLERWLGDHRSASEGL